MNAQTAERTGTLGAPGKLLPGGVTLLCLRLP